MTHIADKVCEGRHVKMSRDFIDPKGSMTLLQHTSKAWCKESREVDTHTQVAIK